MTWLANWTRSSTNLTEEGTRATGTVRSVGRPLISYTCIMGQFERGCPINQLRSILSENSCKSVWGFLVTFLVLVWGGYTVSLLVCYISIPSARLISWSPAALNWWFGCRAGSGVCIRDPAVSNRTAICSRLVSIQKFQTPTPLLRMELDTISDLRGKKKETQELFSWSTQNSTASFGILRSAL